MCVCVCVCVYKPYPTVCKPKRGCVTVGSYFAPQACIECPVTSRKGIALHENSLLIPRRM